MGERAHAASSVSYKSAAVCEGRPNIRSRLILSNPALRAISTEAITCSQSLILPKSRKSPRLPCRAPHRQPVDTRFAQRLGKGRRECPRLHSQVISAPSPIGNASNSASRMRAIWNSSSNEGVPPPRKNRIRFRMPRSSPWLVISGHHEHLHSAGISACASRVRCKVAIRGTCLRKRAHGCRGRLAAAKILCMLPKKMPLSKKKDGHR